MAEAKFAIEEVMVDMELGSLEEVGTHEDMELIELEKNSLEHLIRTTFLQLFI